MSGDQKIVLLVEDNAVNRDMLIRRLTRAGHTVIAAEDGAQALRKMREQHPAVVLMDMNLPVKDGWTASREASADPELADIPIVALTAHAMDHDREQALAAGCVDYATKPIDFPELLAKIDKWLGQR
jgi:two-component system cell cycle response regulator DivK